MIWPRICIGHRHSLRCQFLLAAALTVFMSMTLLAFLLSRQIEKSMMNASAEEAGIVMDVLLGQTLQPLATSSELSPDVIKRLDQLLETTLSDRTKAFKIWLRDGTLVYANDRRFVGQKFPSAKLDRAFKGGAFASFADTDDQAHEAEQELNVPLIEIYAPVNRSGTREVIAVSEVYNSGTRLAGELRSMHWTAVGIVGAVTAPMMAILYLMVSRASDIVKKNRLSLLRKIHEAQTLASQNNQLRLAKEAVQLDAMQSNEKLLDQIGQDLHDGPVQLVSILALRLSEVLDATSTRTRSGPGDSVTDLTAAILKELRDISAGLVLPELNNLDGTEALHLAVTKHQAKTGTRVSCEIGVLSFKPSPTLQICMFRAVQECLNNAFIHGDGEAPRLTVSEGPTTIILVVSNSVSALPNLELASTSGTGLGLAGLRKRVSVLNGKIDARQIGNVMRVTVELPKHTLQKSRKPFGSEMML